MRRTSHWVAGALAALLISAGGVDAQINKEIAENAPNENVGPMPHLDPDNPNVIRLKEDPARDLWRP